jgi:GH25 family lysozyme M1 (1,4-beta-N-acetylmuramidase)
MPVPRLTPPAATVIQPERRTARMPLVVVALVAGLLLTLVAAAQPVPVLGATSLATRCDGVALRTKPRATAHRVAKLSRHAKVVAVAVVSGGSWKTTCAGRTSKGSKWYRITVVNGKRVSGLYGVDVVYAAKSLFKVRSYTLSTLCDGTRLRTKPTTSARTKVKLSAGTIVKAKKVVSGGSWSAACGSDTVKGAKWYRIVRIDGKSVSSLYGVSALYGAKGLFTKNTTPSPTPTPTPTPTPDPPSGYIEGIDVSHWQGTINWPRVAASGKKFVFMKASESTDYVDPTYQTNRAQAEANGLLVGAYHFGRPCTTSVRPCDAPSDPAAEADHFIDTARWASGELFPVLDLEDRGGLSTAKLQTWVQRFLGRVYDRTGVRAMIYVSPYFWSSNMGDTTWFADNGYKILWVAHWTTASAPSVPADDWAGNGWTFWQYTSDGSVPGIGGRVDLDRYRLRDFGPVLIK